METNTNTIIEHVAPKTAQVLKNIPGILLHFGIPLMGFILGLIIFSSVELVHFKVNETVKAQYTNNHEFIISKKNIEKVNINHINSITITNTEFEKGSDFKIIEKNENVYLEFKTAPVLEPQQEFIEITLSQEKNLSEIIIGDIVTRF